jgi:hypothetical protein
MPAFYFYVKQGQFGIDGAVFGAGTLATTRHLLQTYGALRNILLADMARKFVRTIYDKQYSRRFAPEAKKAKPGCNRVQAQTAVREAYFELFRYATMPSAAAFIL